MSRYLKQWCICVTWPQWVICITPTNIYIYMVTHLSTRCNEKIYIPYEHILQLTEMKKKSFPFLRYNRSFICNLCWSQSNSLFHCFVMFEDDIEDDYKIRVYLKTLSHTSSNCMCVSIMRVCNSQLCQHVYYEVKFEIWKVWHARNERS